MVKQVYLKYKMLLPLLLLTGFCGLTIVTSVRSTVEMGGIEYGFILTEKHYGAFLAIALCLFAFFAFRRHFKYVFSITLLLGLFCIINFTPLDRQWTLGLGSLEISFQPTALFIGLLTLALNLTKLVGYIDSKPEISSMGRQNRFNEDVVKFKLKYMHYSTNDLIELASDQRFTSAAIEAARQIIDERQANM